MFPWRSDTSKCCCHVQCLQLLILRWSTRLQPRDLLHHCLQRTHHHNSSNCFLIRCATTILRRRCHQQINKVLITVCIRFLSIIFESPWYRHVEATLPAYVTGVMSP